ncbi:hypothetical protein [Paraburkholderia aromaticivorans]|uniref:Uncharacterized protein n=1 Tax=Paraburkholderia aromaticivorans TaxID=2026199 RepID=A0A248VLT8_9BURK|nr:hypothetical protein [Paraburkholderia aromaticivorans]ASW00028.1 hypothetical protein CJU94_18870 [Paraburkholderia aromaticivorans]
MMKFFNRADLNKDDEKRIREILKSPEIESILDRAEQAAVAHRAELRRKLDTVAERHEAAIAEAGKAHAAAIRHREESEEQQRRAWELQMQAGGAEYAATHIRDAEKNKLLAELMGTADARLRDFGDLLGNQWQALRHLGSITEYKHKSWTGQTTVEYSTNTAEVNALMAQIEAAQAAIKEMALLPLTSAEVAERLTALTHEFQPKLEAFALPCPRLNEKGEVELSKERVGLDDTLRANGLPTDAAPKAGPAPRVVREPARQHKAPTPARAVTSATGKAAAAVTTAKRVFKGLRV